MVGSGLAWRGLVWGGGDWSGVPGAGRRHGGERQRVGKNVRGDKTRNMAEFRLHEAL